MKTILTLEVRKLAPELLQDFLSFFEGDAFVDNPKWGTCFCQFLYVDHAKVGKDDDGKVCVRRSLLQ